MVQSFSLARGDVLRLRKSPFLAIWLVGWLVGWGTLLTSALMTEAKWSSEMLAHGQNATLRGIQQDHHQKLSRSLRVGTFYYIPAFTRPAGKYYQHWPATAEPPG
jgi:hypothetical protein